jgi:glycerol-3-phosphate acyltransferase PlsY
MLRSYGWKMGLLTLVCDAAKGVAATIIANLIVGEIGMYVAAVCVVGGHTWSCFMKFKGGKGIATAVGGVAAIAPLPAVAAFVVWLAVFKISGYVSLGSIVAAVALPVLAWGLGFFKVTAPLPWSVIGFFALLAAVAVWTHRSNIVRLINGTENSFRKK